MLKTSLNKFSNNGYNPGNPIKILIWYYINLVVFNSGFLPFYGIKIMLLKLFGAKIGKGLIIKPYVNIKYPWFLNIGDYCWIGEGVWIDNLAMVTLGSNVSISQGAFLLTGNHNYKRSTFDLVTEGITIEEGVWIGAKSVVCPGITCKSHAVLTVGSIATKNLEAYCIYQGNPAIIVKERIIT